MSRPLTGAASDPPSAVPDGAALVGIDIADPELAAAVSDGMRRVETMLHDVLRSEFDFATRTSLHLVNAGGKRFRPLFTLLAAQFGDSGGEDVIKAAAIVEMVHQATLYHDDVMDEATLRRGATTANARWDNSIAILTGDFLFAQASNLVSDLGVDAVRLMSRTFEALVKGQMRETVGAAADEDAVEHYLTVAYEKTGSLIATAGRFGATYAGSDDVRIGALERIGKNIGIGFQISDDIIDIASPSTESGKTPGTDLREGVRTLPMLYALAEDETETRLRELLSGPITDDGEVGEALELLRASDGMTRARRTLDRFADDARTDLALLPDGPAREALAALADYVVERTR